MTKFNYTDLDQNVVITAVADVTLPLPIPNSEITLKAGDTLTVKPNSSMELVFFDKLAESLGADVITMTPVCRTEETESTDPEADAE